MLINVFFIIFLFFMKYILKFIPLKFIPKDYLVRGVKRTRSDLKNYTSWILLMNQLKKASLSLLPSFRQNGRNKSKIDIKKKAFYFVNWKIMQPTAKRKNKEEKNKEKNYKLKLTSTVLDLPLLLLTTTLRKLWYQIPKNLIKQIC